jgi:hypothetical protein
MLKEDQAKAVFLAVLFAGLAAAAHYYIDYVTNYRTEAEKLSLKAKIAVQVGFSLFLSAAVTFIFLSGSFDFFKYLAVTSLIAIFGYEFIMSVIGKIKSKTLTIVDNLQIEKVPVIGDAIKRVSVENIPTLTQKIDALEAEALPVKKIKKPRAKKKND